MAMLACLALGSGAGLAVGLAGHPASPADGGRALSVAEARRLAAMRVTNYRHGRAGIRATLGPPEAPTRLVGSVDWGQSLIYLAVDGPGNAARPGLVQAVPGLLATRPDTDAPPAESGYAPPAVPPADGWRIRRLDSGGSRPEPVDALVTLLFGIAADRPDPADELAHGPARWLGRDQAAGNAVDVLLGPAVPATAAATGGRPAPAATSLAQMGGGVRYWLDGDAQLHRLAAVLPGGLPLSVDLDRAARPGPIAIDGLGGPAVRPRAVTNAEADQLAGLRSANRARQGARVSLAVPTLPAVNLRGGGWLDWRAGVAYLTVADLDSPDRPRLLWADHSGIADRAAPAAATDPGSGSPGPRTTTGSAGPRPSASSRTAGSVDFRSTGSPGPRSSAGPRAAESPGPRAAESPGPRAAGSPGPRSSAGSRAPVAAPVGVGTPLPPLPPPADRDWAFNSWQRRTDGLGGLDLDLLINEALSCGLPTVDDTVELRASAVWLRDDTLAGRPVSVFEMPKPAEAGEPAGHARLRYWIDGSGLLRRLELRTRTGAYAQLDLDPGPVPRLAPPPMA